MTDNATKAEWGWWAGRDDEWFTFGPEPTREAAIESAIQDGCGEYEYGGRTHHSFHIVEAKQEPLRLADWIGVSWMLEQAEERLMDSDRVCSEYDDGPWFEATKEQEADLATMLKAACDAWQAKHDLTFTCSTFSHARNHEYVDTREEAQK